MADPRPESAVGTGPLAGATRSAYIQAATAAAYRLYDGRETPHRSCGIALAETFGVPSAAYQALRRGGITGEGTCGAVLAGTLLLGQILGDPSPTGAVTPELREAVQRYRAAIAARLDHSPDTSCNTRTAPLQPFAGPARHAYCTSLAAEVASVVAEILCDLGRTVPLPSEGDPDGAPGQARGSPSGQPDGRK